jgi:hypothetical protein
MSAEQLDEGRAGRDEAERADREAERADREAAERAMRRLLREHDLPEPDEILDHEDGGIVCLWHEPKVAIVVDLEPRPA